MAPAGSHRSGVVKVRLRRGGARSTVTVSAVKDWRLTAADERFAACARKIPPGASGAGAIDRFGLLLYRAPGGPHSNPLAHGLLIDDASTGTCVALIVLGIVMVLATGFRFLAYAKTWGVRHRFPAHHGPYLASFFAVMVALFGIVLLVIIGIAAT